MSDQEPTQQDLIDATNMLCLYAQKNLPKGYEIVLCMDSKESSLTLLDPFGEDAEEVYASDSGYSGITALCDSAKELEEEGSEEEEDE